jgi:hypothetical protein
MSDTYRFAYGASNALANRVYSSLDRFKMPVKVAEIVVTNDGRNGHVVSVISMERKFQPTRVVKRGRVTLKGKRAVKALTDEQVLARRAAKLGVVSMFAR